MQANDQLGARERQHAVMQLAILPEDADTPDSAAISALGQHVAAALREGGYTVQPTYTGERGGSLFEIVSQILEVARQNQDLLAALVTAATPVVQYLFEARKDQGARANAEASPVKVTIEVDGAPVVIESADVASAAKMAEAFRAAHPAVAAKVTARSRVKVIGTVPARPSRRRR